VRKGSGERGREGESHAFEFCQLESRALFKVWLAVLSGEGMRSTCVLLLLLAAVSLGIAIADLFYTGLVVCGSAKLMGVCPDRNSSLVFTWIASGVWCSLFVSIIILQLL